jgi:hypothetical protein
VILAGTHPLAVDCVAATVMGFDWERLRLLEQAFRMTELSFVDFEAGDMRVVSNRPAWNGPLAEMTKTFSFRPHFGWVGAIERQRASLSA